MSRSRYRQRFTLSANVKCSKPGLRRVVRRTNFPVELCWAASIDSSEGRTLRVALLDCLTALFSHGHLLVGSSRTQKARNLLLLHLQHHTHVYNPLNALVLREVADLQRRAAEQARGAEA